MEQVTIGTVVGGHELEALIGRGGMGVVYRARHVLLDRTVALKLLAPDLADDAEFRSRFERESRIAAALDHPNVVPVHDAGEDDGRLFITMRYVDGTDLREMIAVRGGLPPELAAEMVAQVGSALDAAHAHGLVHRDVKPANVLVADPRAPSVYLTDFGLTKRSASSSGLTGSGLMVGTLDYMSPEQFAGASDARTDVYALGCVLFEALTGRVPFPRATAPQTLWAHMSEPPPSVGGEAGEAFDPVIARALAKQPADRFPSTGDLGRAALAAAQGRREGGTERSVAVGEAAPGPTQVDLALPEKPPPGAATPLEPPPAGVAGASKAATILEPPAPLMAQSPEAASPPLDAAAPVPAQRAGEPREEWWRQQPKPAGQRPPGWRRLPGWGRAAIAGGLAALIAVVLVVAATTTRESPRPEERDAGKSPAPVAAPAPTGGPVDGPRVWVTTTETGLAALDPRTGRTTGTLSSIAGKISDIATGEGGVWVIDENASTLLRVDARRGRLVRSFALPDSPEAVAVGLGSVWVSVTGGTVRIDPDTNRMTSAGEATGYSLVTQGGYLWAADHVDDSINRISPSGGIRRITRRLGGEPELVAADTRRLFVLTDGGNMLRVEQGLTDGPPRLTSVRTGTSDAPGGLAVGEGGVWVADDRKITRYDPETLERETRRSVNVLPEDIAVGAGAVWVTGFDQSLVVRVDPRTGAVQGRFAIPAEGGQIAVSR